MALSGRETLQVLGQSATGVPAGIPFQTTTQDIADLSASASAPGLYNVLDYGAIGNGVADDAAAIQLAITAAQNALGGTVSFPGGTYLVSTPLILTSSFVNLVGEGIGVSIVLASGNTLGTLLIGNQSISQSGKSAYNTLRDMTFQCPAASSAINVTAYGVTRLEIERCDLYRGSKAIQLRNADQTMWLHSSFRVTAASAIAVNLVQGSSDDVTTMTWIGGIVDVTGTGGKAVVFADGSGGTPNEFNDIFMCGMKLDGNNTASTISVQFVAGVRNLRFQNVEFKEWTTSSVDGATALLTGQNVYYTVDNCKVLGHSITLPVQHFYVAEATSGITYIEIRNTQMSDAVTAVRISNSGTKSPKLLLNGTESFVCTNWLEADDTTVTPNIGIGQVRIGGSVTNKVGTNLASSTVSWEDHGTRAGNFLLYAQGTITVADGQTTSAVVFGSALNYTPSAKDITVIKTDSAIGGQFWVTSISATGFTLNVQTAPSGTTFTYQYKLRAS